MHPRARRQLQATLEAALSRLENEQVVILAEPDRPGQAPRRGLFRSKSRVDPGRYVQVVRWPDALTVECIGPRHALVTDEQQRQILALGFRPPDARPGQGAGVDNYRLDVPLAQLTHAAQVGVLALEALGVPGDTSWQWTFLD